VAQGFNGAAWYHYFGATGSSVYITAGIGLYNYRIDNNNAADLGLAILFGGGFEFAHHWQAGVYCSFGRTSTGPYNYEHSNLNLLISTVAY